MPERIPIGLDAPALHVDVRPGGEIVISGSYKSTFDGSEIDAATTTWPAGAPGGQSVELVEDWLPCPEVLGVVAPEEPVAEVPLVAPEPVLELPVWAPAQTAMPAVKPTASINANHFCIPNLLHLFSRPAAGFS